MCFGKAKSNANFVGKNQALHPIKKFIEAALTKIQETENKNRRNQENYTTNVSNIQMVSFP